MFFIVNRTKKRITLNDLNLTLGPQQAVDLDRLMDREKSENSSHLRSAQSHGDIEIRVKDNPQNSKIPDTPPRSDTKKDLSKIKDDIINELNETIRGLSKQIAESRQPITGLTEEDLDKIAQKVAQSLPDYPVQQVVVRTEKKLGEEVEMDDSLLTEINTRAVNKMVKDVSSTPVKYQEEVSKDDILGNVDELSDLLG